MKKFLLFFMYTLLLAFLAGCGSDSVGNDDVGNNSTMTDSIIRNDSISEDGKTVFVCSESLPGWLRSWISSREEAAGVHGVIFREQCPSPELYRGELDGKLIYHIEEFGSSALFGLLFNENGSTPQFEDGQAFVDFCNIFQKIQKRVYIK